jgi:hypothetical protein
MPSKTVCIDFDGVIHHYVSGWRGPTVILDPPVPGALRAMRSMVEAGILVAVHSSRSHVEGGIEAMRQYIGYYAAMEEGLDRPPPWVEDIQFPLHKPPALVYIDDRGYCFDGDWSKVTPEMILAFEPWNRRREKVDQASND